MGDRPNKRRRGFALLIVMILIVLLAILVFAFQRDVAREVSIAGNVRDDLKSAYLANMALVRAQVILRLDEHEDYDSLNELWAEPLTWVGETWGNADGVEPAGGITPPEVRITDEERKFNLLMLVRGTDEQKAKAQEILQRLIGICRREDDRLLLDGDAKTVRRAGDDNMNTETLVKNLVKYLEERASEDSDDLEFTANPGAKADVRSMKKQTPYEMLTLGELLQVEGWNEELLYGPVRRADQAMVASAENEDPEEKPRDWRDLTDVEKFEQRRTAIESIDQRSTDPNPLPLIGFITIYSPGLVNINTAPREVLLALDERLTWEVVEQMLTAREADRQDVVAAEENGGTLPEEEEEPTLDEEGQPVEEEDNASFRPTDMASYNAFITRMNNATPPAEGEPPAEIEGFTEEIYTAIRPWLIVKSTVFEVEAMGISGKIRHTIRAVYRRGGTNAAPAPTPPTDGAPPTDGGTPPPATDDSAATGEDALPPEPTMTLTLLFRDVSVGG